MQPDPSAETNTYFFDPENAAEMARLIQLDRVMTKGMGGPLAEQLDLSPFRQILDIACGPGGWVLDVAFQLPRADVAGIDISQTMISYANARARSQKIANASFGVMNATQPLDLSPNSFDLVNGRLLVGFLPKPSWSRLVQECYRITKVGGILRLTETDGSGLTNSPAYERLNAWFTQAIWKMGYGFSPDGRTLGVTPMLAHLLKKGGYQNIQHEAHAIDFSAETEAFHDFYRNAEVGFKLLAPLLVKMGVAAQEEIDQTYQQMLIEMLSSDFCGVWNFLTVWGKKV